MILRRGSALIAESMSAKRAKSIEGLLRSRLPGVSTVSSTHDVHVSSEARFV